MKIPCLLFKKKYLTCVLKGDLVSLKLFAFQQDESSQSSGGGWRWVFTFQTQVATSPQKVFTPLKFPFTLS